MSANDDLRLAWLAHRQGQTSRRDALLTLAVAAGEPQGAPWVGLVRDFLVKTHPGHLFDGFYQLDEALADRRVIAGLNRLRHSFPAARVRHLVQRSEVVRSPYTGRRAPAALLLDDMLEPPEESTPQTIAKLGSSSRFSDPSSPPAASDFDANSILAFYMNVLLGVATLCALVLRETQDDKRAA